MDLEFIPAQIVTTNGDVLLKFYLEGSDPSMEGNLSAAFEQAFGEPPSVTERAQLDGVERLLFAMFLEGMDLGTAFMRNAVAMAINDIHENGDTP